MSGVVQVGKGALKWTYELTHVTFSPDLTYLSDEMFMVCSAIKALDLPDSLTRIGEKTFYDCMLLTHLSLPQGVTEIGNQAFAYCGQLKQIRLSKNLKKVGTEAFYNCKALSGMVFPKELTQIGDKSFGWYCSGYSGGLRSDKQQPFLVCGFEGSGAEQYAVTNNYSYQSLDFSVMGNMDGNAEIDAKDALIVLQMSVGKKEQTIAGTYIGDMTEDGVLNALDALRILQLAVIS